MKWEFIAMQSIHERESGQHPPSMVALDATGYLWSNGRPWPNPRADLHRRIVAHLERVERFVVFSRSVRAMGAGA